MTALSTIVVGRDQSLTLAACLQSLRGVDRIVYLDTGSTDDSIVIAEQRGAKILSDNTVTGGAQARNLAALYCPPSWAIWLSPDDILEDGGVDKIREAIKHVGDEVDGLNVTIREAKFPESRFVFPRVFRTSCQWIGRAHEYLAARSTETIDVTITHMRGPWHDKPTDPLTVMRLLWADLQDDPGNPRWLYYYAREHFDHGDLVKAAYWFERRIQTVGYPPEMADAYLYLARCYWQLQRGDDARQACASALIINSNFAEAARFMAELTLPQNQEQWRQMAASADNRDVLFVR